MHPARLENPPQPDAMLVKSSLLVAGLIGQPPVCNTCLACVADAANAKLATAKRALILNTPNSVPEWGSDLRIIDRCK